MIEMLAVAYIHMTIPTGNTLTDGFAGELPLFMNDISCRASKLSRATARCV